MGAKIASFLATLLLSIPLAAIGLMAVFGVPDLLPAGPQRDQVVRGLQNALNWRNGNQSAQTSANPAYEDLVPAHSGENGPSGNLNDAPAFGSETQAPPSQFSGQQQSSIWGNTPAANPNPNGPRHWTDGGFPSANHQALAMNGNGATHSPNAHNSSSPPLERSPFTASTGPSNMPAMNGMSPAMRQPANAPFNGPMLNWRQASSKLTELGIRNYHLERGSKDETFLFVCLFSPSEAPQVTHRFEAEADDPLTAVNQVLQQLDHWMQTRVPSHSQAPARTATASFPGGSSPW